MNIIEALNKQIENPKLVIYCKKVKYKQPRSGIFSNILSTNYYRDTDKIKLYEPCFSVEEVLSDDWEVVE
jgi:hypothetical protein